MDKAPGLPMDPNAEIPCSILVGLALSADPENEEDHEAFGEHCRP